MNRALVLTTLLSTILLALPAGAPPPQGVFPSALFPADTSRVPANAKVFVFGKDAPRSDAIGLAVRSALGPVDGDRATIGCCLVLFRPLGLLPEGEGTVLLSVNGEDLSSTFEVDRTIDEEPPIISDATALDDQPGGLLVAVEATDNSEVVGAVAELDGEVVSAAPVGTLLELRGFPAGSCFDILAVDIAANESDPVTLCDRGDAADGGPSDPSMPPMSCAMSTRPGSQEASYGFLALLGLLLSFARRRRHALVLAVAAMGTIGVSACDPVGGVDGGTGDAGVVDGGLVDGGSIDAEGTRSVLRSLDDYESLQSEDGKVRYLASVASRPNAPPVDDGCRFQDSAIFPYHLQYLQAELGDEFSLDDYTALTLDRETRAWWGGELWWRPQAIHPVTNAPGVLLYLVYATDDAESALSADDIREADAALKACAPGFAASLAFTPGSLSQRQMVESERAALANDGVGVVLNPS